MVNEDRPETLPDSDGLNVTGNIRKNLESQMILDQVLPENYRSCLDAIDDLMCLKGEDLEYLFVNKAFCSLLGLKQELVLGKRSVDIFPKDVA